MDSSKENLVSVVERMGYTVIAMVLAIYLLNLVISIGYDTYGQSLLNGVSVFLVIGSIILILSVAYNIFNVFQDRAKETRKR